MNFDFYKYQGAGNDFVIIDNRQLFFEKESTILIRNLCDRRFGIGGDGLILLENDPETDFKMVYYNADGKEGSMCGNGGRCIVQFARFLKIIDSKTTFTAVDGLHFATFNAKNVSLKMNDVAEIKITPEYCFLNTGSPHHVQMVPNLSDYPVFEVGKKLRNGLYGKEGSNINFVEKVSETEFNMRTFERGVEDETLACGTGATAVAIAMRAIGKTSENKLKLNVLGGTLSVQFRIDNDIYSDVFLEGSAIQVFKGKW